MKIMFILLSCFYISQAFAYEASEFVKITQIRSTVGGDVFFDVDIPAAMCNTSTFLVKVMDDGSKAVYSALLSAAMSGKSVKLETWGECAANGGWGTQVQGLYVQF